MVRTSNGFGGGLWRPLACLVWLWAGLAACASDPRVVHWEAQLRVAEKHAFRGEHAEALSHFRRLQTSSPTAVDADLMRRAQAASLQKMGREGEGFAILTGLAQQAVRRSHRARAHYDIARLADRLDLPGQAQVIFRQLVRVYPELMPGSTALLELERRAREAGGETLREHLAWTARVYSQLKHTTLADNLISFAAHAAARRFQSGEAGAYRLAYGLWERLLREHPTSDRADDARWNLSYLQEASGDFFGTVAAIRGIQRQRQQALFLGDSEHAFYWKGELRIARLWGERLDRPRNAIASYRRFVRDYPDNRWHDDALYWLACLQLRVGDEGGAEATFEMLKDSHPHSRYTGREGAARADPRGAACRPKEFLSRW